MKLLELVNTYVTFKRSLGMRFTTQPRVLRRFSRVLGDIDVREVTPEAVESIPRWRQVPHEHLVSELRAASWTVLVCRQPWLYQSACRCQTLRLLPCRPSGRTSIRPRALLLF